MQAFHQDHPEFHRLHYDGAWPTTMNNPFDYELHAVCRQAISEALPAIHRLMEGTAEGKMFGVLVVENTSDTTQTAPRERGFLMAFSGQIANRASWPGFVPPVCDYLQPDGYFKQEEARISSLNRQAADIADNPTYLYLLHARESLRQEAQRAVQEAQFVVRMGKQLRDQRRREGFLSSAEQDEMIRESQYQKAELHRTRLRFAEKERTLQSQLEPFETQLQQCHKQRKERSEALQRWLFTQFDMLNAVGQRRNLLDIFAATPQGFPPAGAGECCEPRLLQYAYAHGLRPLQMAMFWYGPSPRDEVRHHLQCYPACRGKCKPILDWMMSRQTSGPVQPDLEREEGECFPKVAYNGSSFLVLQKPAGLLSVPGRSSSPSVYAWVKARYPDAEGPLIVHRLDQDTSGLMVVALTKETHRLLQQQFLRRQVQKTYVAELERPVLTAGTEGLISLPLMADPLNRPYQRADHEKGKEAITRYKALTASRLELCPLTGRTHQLRVHCAHREGLGCPIKGDRLYGHTRQALPAEVASPSPDNAADSSAMPGGEGRQRLCLHARTLSFFHPFTHERLTFEWEPPF